jgi:hypothetical protein
MLFSGYQFSEASDKPTPKQVLIAALDAKCKYESNWIGAPDFLDPMQWSKTKPIVKGNTYYYKYMNPASGQSSYGRWSTFTVTMGTKTGVVKPFNAAAKWAFGKNFNRCPKSMTVTYNFVWGWWADQ